jgi:hypothetical protein
VWRPLTRNEELPFLYDTMPGPLTEPGAEFGQVLGGSGMPGNWRCRATGLELGGCHMQRTSGSNYCYYHDKVQREVITEFADREGRPVSPRTVYPVWPLPSSGYVLLKREAA